MKRLTEKKALKLSWKLWKELEETGGDWSKHNEWIEENYGKLNHVCFLCAIAEDNCLDCPYFKKFNYCYDPPNPHYYWSRKPSARKKYAGLIVKQLEEIINGS